MSDELHVLIEVFAPPGEAYSRMSHALEEIKKFLVPVSGLQHSSVTGYHFAALNLSLLEASLAQGKKKICSVEHSSFIHGNAKLAINCHSWCPDIFSGDFIISIYRFLLSCLGFPKGGWITFVSGSQH